MNSYRQMIDIQKIKDFIAKYGLSSYQLKWIACITMLIDHIGAILLPAFAITASLAWPARMIGRLSFPIFAFQLAIGITHTRNYKKFLTRLFIFALISEPIFDLAFYGKFFTWQSQNIFFTLFLGAAMCIGILHQKPPLLCLILSIGFSYVLKTDYSYLGILLIYLCFYIYENRQKLWILPPFLYLMQGFVSTVFAVIPIALYSGKKGREGKYSKYGFYIFYPLHLILLYFIKRYILS